MYFKNDKKGPTHPLSLQPYAHTKFPMILVGEDKIFKNIPCHVMEYSCYIRFPCGKF
jgi:hypothetical protein